MQSDAVISDTLDYVKFVCGLMAVSHRPPPSESSATIVVHHVNILYPEG